METYRKVLCSDRLPEKTEYGLSKSVPVFYKYSGVGMSYYNHEENRWFANEDIESWLEEIPEVTVEEIASIIDCHLQPLDITGLEAEEINELEMWHDKLVDTIAQSIHRLYGGEKE